MTRHETTTTHDLRALARAVVTHLPTFVLDNPPSTGGFEMLVSPDGARVDLSVVSNASRRLRVSGRPPVTTRHFHSPNAGVRFPSITVSADRSPEAIAADIARRFLPAYGEACVAYLAQRAEAEHRNADREHAMKAIAKALGAIPRQNADQDRIGVFNSNGHGTFTHNSVDLRSLPLATVVAIARAYRKCQQTAPTP